MVLTSTSRLSVMMFLQFFAWGAWYVTVGNYMSKMGMANMTHWAYTASPMAAIVAPFFLGMIADRYFSAQRVLGALHLGGGLILLLTPNFSHNPSMFIFMLFLHMICYMPTLGLTSSIAFQNITDKEKQFPLIRMFGTIGWIAAGIFVSAYLHADETSTPLYVGGVVSLILGVYSFSLPNTPPKPKTTKVTVREIIGLDALSQLTGKPFWIFMISSFLISIPLATYYNFAPIFVNSSGISDPGFKMSFGQMSEVFFLITMPIFFKRLGVKKMILVGMGAWVLRYFLFSVGAPVGSAAIILIGVTLHGICYDFFFVTGHIYVDRKANPDIRSQAQGFFVFATYGVGMLIGAQLSGMLYNHYLAGGTTLSPDQWKSFWMVPSVFAFVIMIYFALQFNDKEVEKK